MAKFEIFKSDKMMRNLWFWHLVGDNGEIMAQSEGYITKQHAKQAADRFKELAPQADIVVETEIDLSNNHEKESTDVPE
jgi:uncharacterized protein YegP (UPF0339 family)